MWSIAVRSLRTNVLRPALGEASTSRLPVSRVSPSFVSFGLHSSAVRLSNGEDKAAAAAAAAVVVEKDDVSMEEQQENDEDDDDDVISTASPSAFSIPTLSPLEELPESFRASAPDPFASSPFANRITSTTSASAFPPRSRTGIPGVRAEFHRLHVHASRNNIIMTLTTSSGDVILRCSSGQLGFKNAARSTYDAAYKVSMFMFERMKENRIKWSLAKLEVIWNGFGQGRDAVYRALMSNEGADIRNLIRKTADNTAIKVGGTRPKKRRML